MKKFLTGALMAGMATAAQAEDVTLQLKWVTQAQFAGYYVAQAKGFYEDEGLNVTILPGGPDIAPPQVIAGGGADVAVEWMPAALAAREKGLPLVNIAQPFASSGMMLTCLKESGVATPADFADKTLGVWFFGNEYPFLSWMSQLGLKTDGSPGGVTGISEARGIIPSSWFHQPSQTKSSPHSSRPEAPSMSPMRTRNQIRQRKFASRPKLRKAHDQEANRHFPHDDGRRRRRRLSPLSRREADSRQRR